jgi:hypothetical protein
MCFYKYVQSHIIILHQYVPVTAVTNNRVCYNNIHNQHATVYWLCKGKGKAVPLQAWSGPEGSRKLKFPDFMTTAQDGGKIVSLTHRPPLPPGNTPGTHFR